MQLVAENADLVLVYEKVRDHVEQELADVFKARGNFGFFALCLELPRGIQSGVSSLGDEAQEERGHGEQLHYLVRWKYRTLSGKGSRNSCCKPYYRGNNRTNCGYEYAGFWSCRVLAGSGQSQAVTARPAMKS